MYKMQVLFPIPDRICADVDKAIEDFVWKGKRPKITLETLKLNKEDGGLGLVDIKTKHRALICNWIKHCEDPIVKKFGANLLRRLRLQ